MYTVTWAMVAFLLNIFWAKGHNRGAVSLMYHAGIIVRLGHTIPEARWNNYRVYFGVCHFCPFVPMKHLSSSSTVAPNSWKLRTTVPQFSHAIFCSLGSTLFSRPQPLLYPPLPLSQGDINPNYRRRYSWQVSFKQGLSHTMDL